MLQTRLYLSCDGCGHPFPVFGVFPSPVDGAIYTSRMLRAEAKKEGWKRGSLDGSRIDICPRCAKKEAKRKAAA